MRDDVLGRERLVGEAHVHDGGGVPFGSGEVDEPALADQVDAPSVGELELLDLGAGLTRRDRQLAEGLDLDLDVEVAGVREDGAVLQPLDRSAGDDVLVPGRRAEDIAHLGGALHRHHLVAVHERLERPHGVDFGDDHVRAHPARPQGNPAAGPAVARDDEAPPREEHVGRPDDPVDGGLAGPVAVVEEVLRQGLVDGDDRKSELPLRLQGAQADDAGCRLLRPAHDLAELVAPLLVQDADHVGAVVHRQLRPVVDRGLDVGVVRVVVLAADRVDGDPVLLHERRRDVVLRRQRIGGTEDDVGAPGVQRAGQVGGLRGHVQARGDAHAVQGPLALEALADGGQHRHLGVGPQDPGHARRREREILHVMAWRSGAHGAAEQSTSSRASVAILEAHDVVTVGCRDFEHERVLERAPAVHDARRQVESAPGPYDLHVRSPARLSHLELDAARMDVDGLVLAAVELEAELLARADEEHLAQIAVARGVDELVAPRLLDPLDGDGEAVEVEQVRRQVFHRAVIPQARRVSQASRGAPAGTRRRFSAPWAC